MKRRLVAAVALSAVAALALSACSSSGGGGGGGSAPPGQAVTLKLVAADYGTGPSNSSQKYWEGIAKDFHAKYPTLSVDVQTINWNDFDNQVQTKVQNKDYPDVLEGDYFPDYAQAGLLYPAKDVMSSSTYSNLISVFAKLDTYNGTQYGMPFTTSARTLFYNKQLFQQAGISAPPQTWDDIKTDAGKIKAQGKIGFGLPLGPEEAQAEALLWFLGDGGGYEDASGNWTINSQQNVAALQFMAGLVSAGLTEPNPATKNRTDLWKQFAQGDIGMINGSPALIPIIKDGGKLSDSDWASVAIAGQSGPLDSTLGVCDNVSAFKTDTSKQDAIRKFLDFTYQDKYQLQFDKEYYLLPATNSAVQSMSSDPVFSPFLKALPKSVQYSGDPVWSTVKTQIQQTIGKAMTEDPKGVLDPIQATAEKGA
ncbi:MAG TPA: extracellular solute-binding protein [Jatrophihabitans sp.]|jgi:multiple sugar transport system substrate-binding protein|nr:extracellular solute-binding protein [Jatrophihabitans sp.]